MKKMILYVPDGMAAWAMQWKEWISGMTIVLEDAGDDMKMHGADASVFHSVRRSKTIRSKNTKKRAISKPALKPLTLKYYTHGNNGVLTMQHKRVDIVYRKWNEWGWLDEETSPADFDAFFEGEPRYCNLVWKRNTTVLSVLLRNVLSYLNRNKKKLITEQTGQSATSLVREQFGKSANFDEKRLKDEDRLRIAATVYLLDIINPLPFRKGGGDDDFDTSDAALQAVLSGQLRSTKRI